MIYTKSLSIDVPREKKENMSEILTKIGQNMTEN